METIQDQPKDLSPKLDGIERTSHGTYARYKTPQGSYQWYETDGNDYEETDDPLAGDVDKFVHPDETRSDEQIAHDERVARNLHMSGNDGADEYWADYDEYFGTVNGGEQPEAKEDNTDPAEVPGTPEWHKAHTKTVVDVDGNEHGYFDLGPMFKDMSQPEIAEYLRQGKIKREAEEKRQAYWDELEREGATEDPLAGDVDRWVHPDETKD